MPMSTVNKVKPSRPFLFFGRNLLLIFIIGTLYALMLYVAKMPLPVWLFSVALGAILVALSVWDIKNFQIKDITNLAVAGLGFLALAVLNPIVLLGHFAAAAVMGFIFWVGSEFCFKRLDRDVLGLGDVKFISAATLWIGPLGLGSMLLIASLSGILFVLVRALIWDISIKERIAFGPFLGFGLFVTWLYGPVVF